MGEVWTGHRSDHFVPHSGLKIPHNLMALFFHITRHHGSRLLGSCPGHGSVLVVTGAVDSRLSIPENLPLFSPPHTSALLYLPVNQIDKTSVTILISLLASLLSSRSVGLHLASSVLK